MNDALRPIRIKHSNDDGYRRVPVFVDRDGVLIENCAGYVRRVSDIDVLPSAEEAMVMLSASGFSVFIVTNQAAVGKGILQASFAIEIHLEVVERLTRSGARVVASYICPHAEHELCRCRKPRPGLLQAAAADFVLTAASGYMIGDAASDVQAGLAVGAVSILVETGRGSEQGALLAPQEPAVVLPDVAAAARYIVQRGTDGGSNV